MSSPLDCLVARRHRLMWWEPFFFWSESGPSSSSFCRLYFVRRFWNHTFTWGRARRGQALAGVPAPWDPSASHSPFPPKSGHKEVPVPAGALPALPRFPFPTLPLLQFAGWDRVPSTLVPGAVGGSDGRLEVTRSRPRTSCPQAGVASPGPGPASAAGAARPSPSPPRANKMGQ